MKHHKVFVNSIVIKTLGVGLLFFVAPHILFAERITNFEADITVNNDHTIDVIERITFDFENEERHGIFRYIQKDHPQDSSSRSKERYLRITPERVLVDGDSVLFETEDAPRELSLRIGDPLQTITGAHEYEIAYRVEGALSYFFNEESELYWNVTGNGWDVPIDSVKAIVHFDTGLMGRERFCYEGAPGSVEVCQSITEREQSIIYESSDLASGEGLTIAHSINTAELVGPPILLERTRANAHTGLIIGIGLLWLMGVTYWAYQNRTRHRPNSTIIPQYEPYEDFKPMYSGVLLDGRLDPHDITAGIIYLAEQGFVKIRQTEKTALWIFTMGDYEIELLKDKQKVESEFLRTLLDMIFVGTHGIGSVVSLSDLAKRREKNHKIITELKSAVTRDLVHSGFMTDRSKWGMYIMIGSFFVVAALFFVVDLFAGTQAFISIAVLCVLIVLSGIIIGISFSKQRTKKGYEALFHLKGFKQFLSMTDKERFTFHNAPDKNPEQFMEYLPYAIAFGVEREWAEVFEGISIPEPRWYQGDGTRFSASALTSDLGSFSSTFASSSASSSGSSGSGSSGGGGGGGGGGSW